MTKLIIVEGPDCSGKSTLAQAASKYFDYTYVHMVGNRGLHPAMPEYHIAVLDSIEWNIKNRNVGFVLDRSWPSEFIYGREFRPDLVDRFPFKEFQDRIGRLGGKYIFCMDDDVVERFQKHHKSQDHQYDIGAFGNVVTAYNALMSHMLLRTDTLHYDLTVDGMQMEKVWSSL